MVQKTLTIYELSNYLNTFLDPFKMDDIACNGIQVTNIGPLTKIATAVTASLETLEKARALGVNALIVHHGIFCKNDPHPIIGTKYFKLKQLIDYNIGLLCYHLPLDAHHEVGNNWKAAQELGMTNLRPFAEYGKTAIGVIGTISPLSFEAFKQRAEKYYQKEAQFVKVKDPICSIAIVSGAGEKYIHAAAHAGADCFITGRVDEPVWDHAHEEKISFLSFGHYSTETVAPKALAHHIENTLHIPCIFIATNNPF